MKFGNDTKIGLATLIPGLLLVAAIALFIVALLIHDGDVEKAAVWATAAAVAFFGLLTTVVRLSQSLGLKKAEAAGSQAAASADLLASAAVLTSTVPLANSSSVSGAGRDPLDPPVIDEPPVTPTDARPA